MLDDFICEITCEEYYNEEELWGRIKIESLNHGHDRGCSTNKWILGSPRYDSHSRSVRRQTNAYDLSGPMGRKLSNCSTERYYSSVSQSKYF